MFHEVQVGNMLGFAFDKGQAGQGDVVIALPGIGSVTQVLERKEFLQWGIAVLQRMCEFMRNNQFAESQ